MFICDKCLVGAAIFTGKYSFLDLLLMQFGSQVAIGINGILL